MQRYDEGQLPWLQAVEDEDEPRGVSARKMFAALLVVLLAAALVAATFFWIGRRDAQIDRPARTDRGAGGAVQGQAAQSRRARRRRRERDRVRDQRGRGQGRPARHQQGAQRRAAKRGAQAASRRTRPRSRCPPSLRPRPGRQVRPEASIQLGAFANTAQAERAWAALSARFPTVAAMNKLIVPFPGGIRLRAARRHLRPKPRQACQTLKAAGENCFVAQ